MRVRELIDALAECDPDLEAVLIVDPCADAEGDAMGFERSMSATAARLVPVPLMGFVAIEGAEREESS